MAAGWKDMHGRRCVCLYTARVRLGFIVICIEFDAWMHERSSLQFPVYFGAINKCFLCNRLPLSTSVLGRLVECVYLLGANVGSL